jgi:thiol-disulfide isomerase/thioredoxin
MNRFIITAVLLSLTTLVSAQNNQSAANNNLLQLEEGNYQKFYGDTLPNRIITAINIQQKINKQRLADHIAKYKPDEQFIKTKNYDVLYMAASSYYGFKENNKYQIDETYKRTQPKWERVQDSLFKTLKYQPVAANKAHGKTNALNKPISTFNNDDALISDHYKDLLRQFLLREKERQWTAAQEDPKQFYKQWYDADPTTGAQLFEDDRENLLREKIINIYFTGKTADYLYDNLIESAFRDANPKNIVAIFGRYKKLYPESPYTASLQSRVDETIKKETQPLNDKMVFLTANGTKLNTLEEVLALTKGKTVLVDMWGTWCGPCRKEIEKNSPAIKAYFKDKNLTYLYIANYDSRNEPNWKKLIAYFHMEGTHILANDKLNDDIMKKVKGTGYPTYFIIKKDGSYELSKAGYPMKREVLIKQLETAMAE